MRVVFVVVVVAVVVERVALWGNAVSNVKSILLKGDFVPMFSPSGRHRET